MQPAMSLWCRTQCQCWTLHFAYMLCSGASTTCSEKQTHPWFIAVGLFANLTGSKVHQGKALTSTSLKIITHLSSASSLNRQEVHLITFRCTCPDMAGDVGLAGTLQVLYMFPLRLEVREMQGTSPFPVPGPEHRLIKVLVRRDLWMPLLILP